MGVSAAIGLVAAVAPALTTRAPAPRGAGVGGVSGYRISNVAYSLDAEAPERVSGVSFALEPRGAHTVRVRLGKSLAACTTRPGHATCRFSTPLPRLVELRTLTVLAAG